MCLAFEKREPKVVTALVHVEEDDLDTADISLFNGTSYYFKMDLRGKGIFFSGLSGLGC